MNTTLTQYRCTKCYGTREANSTPTICGLCTCHMPHEVVDRWVTYYTQVGVDKDGVPVKEKTQFQWQCPHRCRNTVLTVVTPKDTMVNTPNHGTVCAIQRHKDIDDIIPMADSWWQGYQTKAIGEMPSGQTRFIKIAVRLQLVATGYLVREKWEGQWIDRGWLSQDKGDKIRSKGTWIKVSTLV